jgi:hypothetical protein
VVRLVCAASFFTAVMGMAILVHSVLILLVAMSGVNASFSVLLRRDYGPLLTCGLMAWARLTCLSRLRDLHSSRWD